jgi:hypothetical protein
VLKESAKFGPGFIIVARILECKSRWVNLIDRDVDVHVVRIVVDHAYALVFSVAERLAKALLDHAQRVDTLYCKLG